MTHTNALLIQADQWPAFCLSLYGNPNLRTPNLDRLAAEGGVAFDRTTCQSPICLPSRVSMMSGQYVSTTKQFGFTGLCDRRMPWLPETMQQAGLHTGAFGKMHACCVGEDRWGFDISAPTIPGDFNYARPRDNHYRAYCEAHGIHFPTDQMHAHDTRGHPKNAPDDVTESMHPIRQSAGRSRVPREHSLETWTTDRAIEFLHAQRETDAPFFAWVSYDRPHLPTTLPEPFYSELDPNALDLPAYPDAEALRGMPRHLFDYMRSGPTVFGMGEADFRFTVASFYKLIEWIDDEVGRLLDTLRAAGLEATTTVVFCADHGDEAGFNGAFDKNRLLSSEAVTRVPLIVRPAPVLRPDTHESRRIHEPVELVDLCATLCSLTGVDPPDGIEGRDLSGAILHGQPLDPHRPVFCEEPHQRLIEHDGWRLIFNRDDDALCQLYDTQRDPEQFTNCYFTADGATVQRRLELKRQLLAFLGQRIHGPYTEHDIESLERGLDPNDPAIPHHMTFRAQNVMHCLRCATFVAGTGHDLLVPFYEAPMLLFERGPSRIRNMYRTRDQAITLDAKVAEPMIDMALRQCMQGIHPVSILQPPIEAAGFPREDEVQALLAGVHSLTA